MSTLYSVCVIYDGSVKCGKDQAFINMQRKSYFEELLTTIAPITILTRQLPTPTVFYNRLRNLVSGHQKHGWHIRNEHRFCNCLIISSRLTFLTLKSKINNSHEMGPLLLRGKRHFLGGKISLVWA